jgi:2-(1,2-epoxy-1,2-dihydrophenyl)acetyl-CoA isomerase
MSVHAEMRGSAAVVTMGWPERRNALDPDRATQVAEVIERATGDAAALVLTGNGAFCSGGDLSYFAELATTARPEDIVDEVYGRVQKLTRALRDCPLPTIAAVDGAAIGLGFDLSLACDQRFAGPEALFVQGWAALGLVHGTAGFAFLESERPGVAWRLLATQERLDRERAVGMGIAERGEPTALDAALERSEQLSRLPRATREGYVTLAREARWPSDDYFHQCAEIQSHLIVSDDFRIAAARALA